MIITKRGLVDNTKFQTSYYMIRGSSNGQTVMVTAGIHGNERASIRAANKLLILLKNDRLQIQNGTLIIVPIVNTHAYKQRIRGVPDLNRTFPIKSVTEVRHPLSAALFRLAKHYKVSWYIDLHEANGLSKINPRFLGQTLITNPKSVAVPPVRRIIKRMNRTISRNSQHFTIRLHPLPGSGRTASHRLLRAKAVTVETCWSLPYAFRVHLQMQVLYHLLYEAGLIRDIHIAANS